MPPYCFLRSLGRFGPVDFLISLPATQIRLIDTRRTSDVAPLGGIFAVRTLRVRLVVGRRAERRYGRLDHCPTLLYGWL
jgi:hypothetical protein